MLSLLYLFVYISWSSYADFWGSGPGTLAHGQMYIASQRCACMHVCVLHNMLGVCTRIFEYIYGWKNKICVCIYGVSFHIYIYVERGPFLSVSLLCFCTETVTRHLPSAGRQWRGCHAVLWHGMPCHGLLWAALRPPWHALP